MLLKQSVSLTTNKNNKFKKAPLFHKLQLFLSTEGLFSPVSEVIINRSTTAGSSINKNRVVLSRNEQFCYNSDFVIFFFLAFLVSSCRPLFQLGAFICICQEKAGR